jgi:hypothetical protein
MNSAHDTAPKIGQFDNPVSGSILVLVIGLIVFGFVNCLFGNILLGLIPAGLGGLWWTAGLTKHSADKPKEVGIITVWEKILRIPEPVVIEGDVILLPFWPFYMDTVKVDMENKDIIINTEAKSRDNIVFPLTVSITGHPDQTDLPDYIQNGKSKEKIEDAIRELVINDVRTRCKTETLDAIYGGALTAQIQASVADLFDSKYFGWKILKTQLVATIPDKIKNAGIDAAAELEERITDAREYETMRIEARKIQLEDARTLVPGIINMEPDQQDAAMGPLIEAKKVRTFDAALEAVRIMRLTRDGKNLRIESTGKGNINLIDTKMSLGGGTK